MLAFSSRPFVSPHYIDCVFNVLRKIVGNFLLGEHAAVLRDNRSVLQGDLMNWVRLPVLLPDNAPRFEPAVKTGKRLLLSLRIRAGLEIIADRLCEFRRNDARFAPLPSPGASAAHRLPPIATTLFPPTALPAQYFAQASIICRRRSTMLPRR